MSRYLFKIADFVYHDIHLNLLCRKSLFKGHLGIQLSCKFMIRTSDGEGLDDTDIGWWRLTFFV